MYREEYVERIRKLVKEDEFLETKDVNNCIYMIDDILVSAGIVMGIRGVEHNEIKYSDVSWDEIAEWGIIIIPETHNYISDNYNRLLEENGYCKIGRRGNRIFGFEE